MGGLITDDSECQKGSKSTFTDVARSAKWIEGVLNAKSDPVLGEIYSEWGEWSACSEFCDGGLKMRTRNCTEADYCGHEPSITQQAPCNTINCATLFGRATFGDRDAKPGFKMILALINIFGFDRKN